MMLRERNLYEERGRERKEGGGERKRFCVQVYIIYN